MSALDEAIRIDTWKTPASDYPRTKVGKAEIVTYYYDPGFYHCYMVRGIEYFAATRNLKITDLQINGKTWMVDDPPHWWGMEEHASFYKGHVLCAGLGLGLMVHHLTANPNVTKITVIEKESDVIELVAPHIPHDKLTIIHDDFLKVSPNSIPSVDGVLFDLFVGDATKMMDLAICVAVEILVRWRKDDPIVRVHGFPNPWVERTARAMLAANFLPVDKMMLDALS